MAIDRYAEILNLVQGSKEDFDKFYNKKVSVAGTRVRKVMQEVRDLAYTIRKEVQAKKSAAAQKNKSTSKKK